MNIQQVYGEKEGIKNYNLSPSIIDRMGIGMLITKIEFWAYQYDFQFQFWGKDSNNVFINRGNVEIASFGGEDSIHDILKLTLDWCEKSNPSVKYPEAVIGKDISLPD